MEQLCGVRLKDRIGTRNRHNDTIALIIEERMMMEMMESVRRVHDGLCTHSSVDSDAHNPIGILQGAALTMSSV